MCFVFSPLSFQIVLSLIINLKNSTIKKKAFTTIHKFYMLYIPLTSKRNFLYSSRFLTIFFQFHASIFTQSNHLLLGSSFLLVPSILASIMRLFIISSPVLSTWPNHIILLNFMNFTRNMFLTLQNHYIYKHKRFKLKFFFFFVMW